MFLLTLKCREFRKDVSHKDIETMGSQFFGQLTENGKNLFHEDGGIYEFTKDLIVSECANVCPHYQSQLFRCGTCNRYRVSSTSWKSGTIGTKEFLSICLQNVKKRVFDIRISAATISQAQPGTNVLVQATLETELQDKIAQLDVVVEFIEHIETCEDCRCAETEDFKGSRVQVRQRTDFKETFFYLEQVLIKHSEHEQCTRVMPVPTGIDFFFAKHQEARKFVDFLMTVLPCKFQYQKEKLVSNDTKNTICDYKHTYCVEIVPISRDNVVCLSREQAQKYGNVSQSVLCIRVSNVITLIDPNTLKLVDVQAKNYWREPFESLCGPKQLTKFYVLAVETVENSELNTGCININNKLADVWLVRSDQVGMAGAKSLWTRTHLGHLLSPGDSVMAFDIKNSNFNSSTFNAMNPSNVPNAIIVRKVFDRTRRNAKRQWKLKLLKGNRISLGTCLETDAFQEFLDYLEEDALIRGNFNIYKAVQKPVVVDGDENDVHPEAPSLVEMLDDENLEAEATIFSGETDGEEPMQVE